MESFFTVVFVSFTTVHDAAALAAGIDAAGYVTYTQTQDKHDLFCVLSFLTRNAIHCRVLAGKRKAIKGECQQSVALPQEETFDMPVKSFFFL